MSRITRSKRTVALSLVAVFALAGVAFAYWTGGGSGTGSATTGTSAAVSITQNAPVAGLYPGGPAQELDFTVNNPASGNQFVNTVTATVTGTDHAGCDASDFTVSQGAAVAQDLPPGDTSFVGAKAPTIAMVNKGTNQDACQNATVAVSFTSS